MNYLVTLSILIVAIINNVQCNERCIRSPVLVGATPITSTRVVLESVDVGANDVKLNMTAEEGEGDNSIEECFLSVEIEDRSEIRPYWALSYENYKVKYARTVSRNSFTFIISAQNLKPAEKYRFFVTCRHSDGVISHSNNADILTKPSP